MLHIHPLGWPKRQWFGCPVGDAWWDGADRLRMKLTALGVPHECELDSPATKANDPAATERVVGWIAEASRLTRERFAGLMTVGGVSRPRLRYHRHGVFRDRGLETPPHLITTGVATRLSSPAC